MVYSEDQMREMSAAFDDCVGKLQDLMIAYAARKYLTDRGREFGVHGFGRRIKSIEYGLRDVFEIVPPEEGRPNFRALNRANAIVQSVTINVFGAIENLAHTWVHERDIRDTKGRLLTGRNVGLGENHSDIYSTIPDEIKDCLSGMKEWQAYLRDYRHALAHRIPPYLVPKTLTDDDAKRWDELEGEKLYALKNYDFDRQEKISREQEFLGTYDPLMTHSYSENSLPVRFHPQLICDALTIHLLGEQFLRHLPSVP